MVFTTKGNEGIIEKGEFNTFTLDTKISIFELSGEDISSKEVTYKLSDRIITVDISGTEHEYFKEGADSYEDAVKKYNKLQD
ncbi:hypothetical protein HSISS2_1377 [Streptococcus sp. HSISS2]|uniref:hypothetical protein n=1 Tax=Streptococcus sp. HSISS2 TaxID=1316411 RepID=UPI00038A6E83|nr:hypothetical protein HSISS2_1377 [Streptococcus sp. HSISS2]